MKPIRFLAAGAALLLLQMPAAAVAQVTASNDVAQLENIYNTNATNPTSTLGWTISSGVSVSGSGISASSGDLTELSITWKGDNFNGVLGMHGASSLTSLTLSGNRLTGIDFSGLSALTSLNLSGNSLTAVGTEFSAASSGMSALTTLNLSNNSIVSIADNSFAGLSSLSTLNLSSNSITSISADALAGLTGLTDLNLSSNAITTIADYAFSDLGSLTKLDLGSTALTGAISANMFNGLSSLTNLSLAFNGNNGNITAIDADAFTDLAALTDLNLRRIGQGLTTIADGTFRNQSNLKTLNLSDNALSAIGENTFSGLTGSLTTLELNDNNIATIADKAFQNLSGVTNLNLSSNALTAINSGTFTGLSGVTVLNLSSNSIQSIADNAFSDQGQLTTLNLNNNKIQSIGANTFNGLSSLTSLQLGRNEISDLLAGAFSDLGKLLTLYLDDNNLTTLKAGYFDGLDSLTNLHLTYNSISSIEKGAFQGLDKLTSIYFLGNNLGHLESGTFDGLSSLTSLALNGSGVTSLDAGVFAGLTSLTSLNLDSNYLTSIDPGIFSGLSSISSISLADNQLTSIDPATFKGLTALKTVDLHNNRLTSIDPALFNDQSNLGNVYFQGNRLSVSQLSALQDKLLDVGYSWGNFNNQTEVYFQRRVQIAGANDAFIVPDQDYLIDSSTSDISYSSDGGATFTTISGQEVDFGSAGDYKVRITNTEATSQKSPASSAALTTTGTISVVNDWSGAATSAYRPSLGGLSHNGNRLALAYLPSVASHLKAGGFFELEGQNDQSGMYIMSWLDAAGLIDLSSDGTDAIIDEYYNPAFMSALFSETVPEIHLGAAQGLRLGAVQPFQNRLRELALSQWGADDFSYGEDDPWRLSFQLQGGRGEMDGDARHQGYDLETRGATVSLDYTQQDWRVGAAINFTHLDQDWDRYDGNIKTKAINAAIYGGRRWGDFFLTGQIAGGHGQVDAERDIPVLGAKAEAGYDVNWFGAGPDRGLSLPGR